MRVVHLAEFAPHRTGLYGTTKDLIMAEIQVGIDAALVDSHVEKGDKIVCRPNLKDGDLPIRDMHWAKQADIIVHHSIIHQELRHLGIPFVLAIHGRPESTFLLEHHRHMRVFGGTAKHGADPRYKAFFTFWEEYMFHFSLMVPKEKLFCVPAPVDLAEYNPEGPAYKFEGNPKILIADMWRDDVTPFNVIMAAAMFKKKYAPEAKLHIIGTAPKKSSMQALISLLKKDGILGEIHPAVENTPLVYRGADMVITPHNIATRVVREALACGTPVVAGYGNPHIAEDFSADSRKINAYADTINWMWEKIKTWGKVETKRYAREIAERDFNPVNTGNAVKKIFEKVLADEEGRWTEQDGLHRRTYGKYEEYVRHQRSKLDAGIGWLEKYEKEYRADLHSRLKKAGDSKGGATLLSPVKDIAAISDSLVLKDPWQGKAVLCLGARTGAEVRAFLDLGCFAVGVDLNPGKDNKYVVTGDFHKLIYPDGSIDIAFTNCLDHVYRIREFLKEVGRVLKQDGLFIVEIEGAKKKDDDKWACLNWDKDDDIIKLFGEFGFASQRQTAIQSGWFRKQIVFRKGVA